MSNETISDEQFDEDEFEDETDEVIRAKWCMDGATTLSEAAEKLEAFARFLRGEEANGKQLTGPIQDDYGFIRPS